MTQAALIILFAGYAVVSYGFVLIKGWDISFRQWVSPLNPYIWPGGGTPPSVAPGKIWP